MEPSAIDHNLRLQPNQNDLDQHQFPNKEATSLKVASSNPSSCTNYYHPTPSPADSGVMSPLTPLSSYTTSMSGPNCTPEQNVISSPEHSVASFAGYSISNGCGSAPSSVCSPYNNFNHFNSQTSSAEFTNFNNTSFSCCSIPNSSSRDENTSATAYMTNRDSEENIENFSYNNYQVLPPPSFCNPTMEHNWMDYSQNLSMQYHHHKNSSALLQPNMTVRIHD
jgi:hypothetical protein